MYRLVAPIYVSQHWPSVEPWIAKAIGRGDPEEDLTIIKHKAMNGVAQIWIGTKPMTELVEFVMVTEGMMLDDVPTLVIRWLTTDNFSDCALDFHLLETWALENGYKRLQAWGRRGWEKKLRPLGFAHNFTVMDKFIIGGVH